MVDRKRSYLNEIIKEFKDINNIYIADGHHRIASSLLYQKRNKNILLIIIFYLFLLIKMI